MALLTSLVLRLALGLMFVAAFLGKIGDRTAEGLSKYTSNLDLGKLSGTTKYIEGQFDGVLPLFLVTPYATVLPWIELITGLFLLFGFVTRTSFAIVAATLASLLFGQVLLGNEAKVIQIGVYFAAALAGMRVMEEVKSGGKKILGVDDFIGGKVTLD